MIKANGVVLAEKTRICDSFFSKAMGLRFKKKLGNEAYVFPFKTPARVLMDMWFVFFPIDVLFLDENKKAVEIKENFKPFTFYWSGEKATYVVELPAGIVVERNIQTGDLVEINHRNQLKLHHSTLKCGV